MHYLQIKEPFLFLSFYYFYAFLAFGFVPFLTSVLGTMMPMLESTKQDNMRWVFASGNNTF